MEILLKLDECVMGLNPENKINKKEQDESVSKVTEISKIAEINAEIEGVKIKETSCESKIECLDREFRNRS